MTTRNYLEVARRVRIYLYYTIGPDETDEATALLVRISGRTLD